MREPCGVFVCHSSRDAVQAMRLVTALEGVGATCWIAPRNVNPGFPYAPQLVQAIKTCEVFLVLITQNSAKSDHVLRELDQATKNHRPILPVVVDDATSEALDYYVSSIHKLHGTDFDQAIALTRDHLDARAKGPSSAPPLTTTYSASTTGNGTFASSEDAGAGTGSSAPAPACSSMDTEHLEIFAIDTRRVFHSWWWRGKGWSSWS